MPNRIDIASRLFCCCERSTEQVTVMPVGLWVMRTADATLFTFWPPGPLARDKGDEVDVALGDFNLFIVLRKLRDHVHGCEGGLPLVLSVERARTDQAVDAGFGLHVTVRIFAGHAKGGALDTGLLAILAI